MRLLLLLLSLWPGLAQAWLLASGRGLLMSGAFAAALNLALLSTFVWPRWPAGSPAGITAAAAWLLVLGLWGAGLAWLRRDWPRLALSHGAKSGERPESEAWFAAAQTEYLRGHWVEAEELVRRILTKNPRDAEAPLLLASIQRRTGRVVEARQTLCDLKQQGAAAKWLLEIESELERLSQQDRRTGLPTRPHEQDGSGGPSYRRAA